MHCLMERVCAWGVHVCGFVRGVGGWGGVFLQMLHEQSAAAAGRKLGEAWKRNIG